MRVTPHDFHLNALGEFDSHVRACFEGFTGLHPNDEQWSQATLSTRLAGLGLRSAQGHAAAAFLASRSASHAQCRDIDPEFVWDVTQAGSHAARALLSVNTTLPESDKVPSSVPLPLKQQLLSQALDKVILNGFLDPVRTREARRAQLRLALEPAAGAWLGAIPNPNFGNQVAPQFFRVMLQRRLRMRVFETSFHCPFCESVMDTFGWGDPRHRPGTVQVPPRHLRGTVQVPSKYRPSTVQVPSRCRPGAVQVPSRYRPGTVQVSSR
eukprot:gene17914-biopygen41806